MTSEAKLDGVQRAETIALPQTEAVVQQIEVTDAAAEEHEVHQHPVGALVLTIFYLLLLTILWVQVYMQLLSSGGIPRP